MLIPAGPVITEADQKTGGMTLDNIYSESNGKIEGLQQEVAQIQNYLASKETAATKRRVQRCQKAEEERQKELLKDNAPFTKQFHSGWQSITEMRRDKELGFADIGKFALLCVYAQQDTGIIADRVTTRPFNRAEMARAIGDEKINFNRSMETFISKGLIIPRKENGKEVFYINPSFSFNGLGRQHIINMIFNNCNFHDHASAYANAI